MQRLLIFLITGFELANVCAQNSPVITLEKCIHLAERNSYRLQSDEYEITVSENAASLAKSRAIPRVSAEVATENRFLEPYYFNQAWASIHAVWSIGDLILKTDRSSAQDIETNRLVKEQNQLDLTGRASSLYISVLQVRKQIEILNVRLALLQHHLELTQGMWKAGMATQLDLLQTESKIVSMQQDTARLDMVRKNLRNELAHILGWVNDDSLYLAPVRMDSIVKIPVPRISPESLSSNPLLASFNSRVKAQQLRTDELAADYIPDLMLGSGYFGDGDPTADGNYWRINAGVIIPIYSGRSLAYRQQGSEAILESLDARKMDLKRELMIHLVNIHEKLMKLQDLIELQYMQESISSKAVEFAELNYKAGISTNLDYLSAQQELTYTQLDIQETSLEYTMSLIEYYLATNQVENIIELGNIQ